MYLKNIEVQGFKSFAQKINFEFHNGITGIVGPNGSGKSNVGDAVRWVLGEQSAKQLRGGNMQDVIFSGTELRKPLSFASVAITLDNSDHKLPVDFEEVTVTVRYRNMCIRIILICFKRYVLSHHCQPMPYAPFHHTSVAGCRNLRIYRKLCYGFNAVF